MDKNPFDLVGIRPVKRMPETKERWMQKEWPVISVILLSMIVSGCLCCNLIMTKDPTYMDFANYNLPPCREFLFGSDPMGRDLFSMIWYGGRISLFIGIFATILSTVFAVIYGAVSGSAPQWIDEMMMRFTEILLSVPSLLFIILIQAVLGQASVWSLSFVIGSTSWFSIAKVVRTEVRQQRSSDYVIASKCMGGGFFHVLWEHLTPNFISSIMFMVVMNVHHAIIAESTLSFLGVGLPLEKISWGSMLSMSEKALLTGSWWILLIPGSFLAVTLVCITNIGNNLRIRSNQQQSNL